MHKKTSINWNIPEKEIVKARIIIKRARQLNLIEKNTVNHHLMNIIAVHMNDTKLDLDKFINFDEYNLAHDIFGIDTHLNKVTARLKNGFLPRSAR